MHRTLSVELGVNSYPIHIGQRLLGNAELLAPYVGGRQVMIVSNETVAPLYLQKLTASLAGDNTHEVILPDGEEYKTVDMMTRIITALLEHRFDRTSILVALGGGVIGDISGFAAACYQRGVDYIQVPTSLLSQVDSSVGGKTAVNHPLGKNMIGAFHQPRCVISDTDTLETLDEREFSAGLAEVVKYGLICDREFFEWLETHMDELLRREPETLAFCIERACQNKARIVAQDERESGRRALLNLGHTFGHAIETGLGYGHWLHGEAVAAGICIAARLSAQLGWIGATTVDRIETLLRQAGLPTQAPPELSVHRMLELMAVDKKVRYGALRLVLLEAIGKSVITSNFESAAVEETLAKCRSTREVV
jgi:3-dehydroquinate synthase